MIWINALSIHTICTLIVVASSASCTAVHHNLRNDYVDHVDLSDASADGVATIQGSSRTMLGLLGEYCWITFPITAKRVTINAESVVIIVKCEAHDVMSDDVVTFFATFHFDALAGHEYETNTNCDTCVQLRDVATNEVVAESSAHSFGN